MQSTSNSATGVREGDVLGGKYRVERVLGIGGMGVVVAAHHLQLDEKVALKFLLPEAIGNADAVARFLREARAAVRIKSEHVARVTDVGTLPNGAPYIVMEYLEGGDLATRLKERGALPIEQAVEFVLQACIAVADAHALGIVHRDLKPANLFCVRRSDGQLCIKVLDFGISKITGRAGSATNTMTADGHAFTRTSALMGSPLYMSPEQMRSSKDVEAQADIWALGIILFELMVGRPPFQADTVMELAIKVANEPMPAIRGFRPEVPNGLEEVVVKCLEKDRSRRYRNVAQLALALLPFAPRRAKASVERISGIIQAAGLSVSALEVPLSPQGTGAEVSAGTMPALGRTTEGTRGRNLAVVGAALVGVVVVVTIAGSVVWSRRRADEGHPQAVAVSIEAPPSSSPPPPAVSLPGAAPDPATKLDAKPLDAPPMEVLPAVAETRPVPAAMAASATTAKGRLPIGGLATAAPQSAAATAAPVAAPPSAKAPPPDDIDPFIKGLLEDKRAAPTPAAAKCEPPYYFDAKGHRHFKKECL